MSKISPEQAKLLWQKLEVQAKEITKEFFDKKEKERVLMTQKEHFKPNTQQSKDKALAKAYSDKDSIGFEEALKNGADMAFLTSKRPFYLDFFENNEDFHYIQIMFNHGLKEKIRNPNELWQCFLDGNNDPLYLFKYLLQKEVYCTDFKIFKDYKEDADLVDWWEKEGVWKYPAQVKNLGHEKVISLLLKSEYNDDDSEFLVVTLNQIKKEYPTQFEKLKKPILSGELWRKALFMEEEEGIGFISHLIEMGFIPPLRFKGNKDDNQTNPLSWPWIALRYRSEAVFNFLMKTQEMRDMFQEDLKNNPEETVFYCATFSSNDKKSLIKILKENQFDFTTVDEKKNNLMHYFLSRYDKNEIRKELHNIIEKNIAFFLKSKNSKNQTMFDIQDEDEGLPIEVIVKGKKMRIDKYKTDLEKNFLVKSLPTSDKNISLIKKPRL